LSDSPTLGLSIPLYDEEAVCEGVVRELVATLRAARVRFALALVNNGSSDGTAGVVNRLAIELPEVRALHLEVNAGYGGGILAGVNSLDTPVVGWIWGDGQVAPLVVVDCYRRLVAEDLQMVKARRVERRDGLQRLAVTRVYNGLMRAAFDAGTDDVNGCPKLIRRPLWERLEARSLDWFLDPEVVLKVRALGVPFGEVDAVMLPRAGGASKVRGETVREFLWHLAAWKRGWRP